MEASLEAFHQVQMAAYQEGASLEESYQEEAYLVAYQAA